MSNRATLTALALLRHAKLSCDTGFLFDASIHLPLLRSLVIRHSSFHSSHSSFAFLSAHASHLTSLEIPCIDSNPDPFFSRVAPVDNKLFDTLCSLVFPHVRTLAFATSKTTAEPLARFLQHSFPAVTELSLDFDNRLQLCNFISIASLTSHLLVRLTVAPEKNPMIEPGWEQAIGKCTRLRHLKLALSNHHDFFIQYLSIAHQLHSLDRQESFRCLSTYRPCTSLRSLTVLIPADNVLTKDGGKLSMPYLERLTIHFQYASKTKPEDLVGALRAAVATCPRLRQIVRIRVKNILSLFICFLCFYVSYSLAICRRCKPSGYTRNIAKKKKKWIKFFQQAGEAGLEKLYLYISGKFPSSVDLRRAGL